MKRIFGSVLVRLLRGGTTLSEGEYALLRSLVRALPERIRSVVESQFSEYNLVQRESDSRALNFYRMRPFSRAPVAVSQLRTRYGKALGPRGALVYPAPRGPSALPPRAG